jgi:translocation and assembly module TamB
MRWLLYIFGGFFAFIVLALALLMFAAHSPSGRIWIEQAVSTASGGKLMLSGLNGSFPGQVMIQRIELHDAGGSWLTIEELAIDWLPMKLLAGEVAIEKLQAKNIDVARLPIPPAEKKTSRELLLLLSLNLHNLQIEQFNIAAPLAGQGVSYKVDGRLTVISSNRGDMDFRVRQLNGEDAYTFQGKLSEESMQAQLLLHEAAHGLLVRLLGLDNHDSLELAATLAGPLTAARTRATLKLDELQALLDGAIDFAQSSVDIAVMASAPAMHLGPDLAWQALALNAKLQGSLASLNLNGSMQLAGLAIAQTSVGKIALKLQGLDGRINLEGELSGLRLTAAQTDVLNAVPLAFQATLGLDQPDHPITFELKHPMLAASGQAQWKETAACAQIAFTLPDLQAVSGSQLAGKSSLTLKVDWQDDNSRWELAGMLDISGGNSSVAKLLRESTKFDLSMTRQGDNIALSGLHLNGKALNVSAEGKLVDSNAEFKWQAQLKNLQEVFPASSGSLAAQGRLFGALDNISLTADLKGELASKAYASGPINANLNLQHLPQAPTGQLNVAGLLLGAPVNMLLMINTLGNQAIQIGINKADWKSTSAKGELMLTQDIQLPIGKIDLQITRLDDLRPLLNLPVTGSLAATLETTVQGDRPVAQLKLDARHAGLAATATVEHSSLALFVNEPLGQAKLKGLLSLDGIHSGEVQDGFAQIKLEGMMDALRLELSADIPKLAGSEAQLSAIAELKSSSRLLAINILKASWQQQTVRLLEPSKLVFVKGLTVDRLRLGLRQAELELSGRFSPDLAISAELHDPSSELLSLFAPKLAITGALHADARLHGSVLQPIGSLRLQADKLQMQHGYGRGLPPAKLNATALLQGELAELDLGLSAGSDISFKLAGLVPMTPKGLFELHSETELDLKRLDPLLNAEGRRLRGLLTVNSKLAGTWPSTSITGSAQLNNGEWQDYALGVKISDISATLSAEDGTIRIAKLQGRSGPGTLSASGSIGLLKGMPVDLNITARNARPLASDRLTVNLDADVSLRGLAAEQLAATGRIQIKRAEIRIPERMPTSIAVLKTSHDAAPPAQSEAGSKFALDLTIAASREIYLRGRGMDAELGGSIHVTGTDQELRPDGRFQLRRGQFTLAGQTLVFSQGSVGFDNGSLTNPSLNFIANTSRDTISASLTVAGSALKPTIMLSSTPELPQDEIMANLLFGHGSATLSPLEMLQIASALASLSGINVGIDDPLESARKRLGLDRLSAGGASPSVEGGRYIAPGVYLGAKQGISGGKPQASLQIDVTKRLKLEGSVGSGVASGTSTTNSFGVIYQFEY